MEERSERVSKFVNDNVGMWGTGSILWIKYLHIHALSVNIYPHNLLVIYLGYRKN